MPELKLYVWKGVLCDYTSGMAFAIAESYGEAVRLASVDESNGKHLQYVADQLTVDACEVLPIAPYGAYVYGGG